VSDRDQALVEVVDLVRRHGLTVDDIASALAEGSDLGARRSGGILARVFAYIGGTFVFAGLAIYVGMRWDDLGPAGRVLLTLGPGFSTFLLALVCTTDEGLERAATPLFLVAALLQPTGILVMMREYSQGGDPAHGVLFMNAVMAIQQGCTFWARRRTVLALTTVAFAAGFYTVALDLLGAGHDLIGVSLGVSLGCIGWSLDRSTHRSLAGVVYFFASLIFLSASYHAIRHSAIDVLFAGLACGTIILSTVTRSRTLLAVGTLALIAYIGNFIAEHFEDNLNAPILLMIVGFLLIAIGAVAVRINNKYIRQTV
jgi:Predicted membrane protein (DUF2157)